MASKQVFTLSIPNNGTDSPAVEVRNVRAMTIIAPAVLTGSVVLQTGIDAAGNGMTTAQSPPGTDISIAAGKATVLTKAPFISIRLHSNLAETPQRDFTVVFEVGE